MAFTRATGALYSNSTTRCGGFYWPTNLARVIGYQARIAQTFSGYGHPLIYPQAHNTFEVISEDSDNIYYRFNTATATYKSLPTFISIGTILYNAYEGFTDNNYHDLAFISSGGVRVSLPALNTGTIESDIDAQVSALDLSYSLGNVYINSVTYGNTPVTAYLSALQTGDGPIEEINNIARVHSEASANVYITGITQIYVTYNKSAGTLSDPSFEYSTFNPGTVYLYY